MQRVSALFEDRGLSISCFLKYPIQNHLIKQSHRIFLNPADNLLTSFVKNVSTPSSQTSVHELPT
jgi:hypothetical protein